jgi:hypothetical protein
MEENQTVKQEEELKLNEEMFHQLNLTISHFSALLAENFSLDHIFLLELASKGTNIFLLKGKRIASAVQTLNRKYLIDADGHVTDEGFKVLNLKFNAPAVEITEIVPSRFDDWWNVYPATDGFKHEGREFYRSRALRISKEDCKKKFDVIIAKGLYTADQIIEATKIDVETRKKASVREDKNKLTFLQNSATYLNQLSFDPFVELIGKKEEKEIKEQTKTVVDI